MPQPKAPAPAAQLPGIWLTETMPPRMPMVAVGVEMSASPEWVTWPPTTRNMPLPSVIAILPLEVAGSKTKLSMTMLEFGPIFSVVLSMKMSCTLPLGEVSIRSSATTAAPISMTRKLPPGAVPAERTLAAVAVPT